MIRTATLFLITLLTGSLGFAQTTTVLDLDFESTNSLRYWSIQNTNTPVTTETEPRLLLVSGNGGQALGWNPAAPNFGYANRNFPTVPIDATEVTLSFKWFPSSNPGTSEYFRIGRTTTDQVIMQYRGGNDARLQDDGGNGGTLVGGVTPGQVNNVTITIDITNRTKTLDIDGNSVTLGMGSVDLREMKNFEVGGTQADPSFYIDDLVISYAGPTSYLDVPYTNDFSGAAFANWQGTNGGAQPGVDITTVADPNSAGNTVAEWDNTTGSFSQVRVPITGASVDADVFAVSFKYNSDLSPGFGDFVRFQPRNQRTTFQHEGGGRFRIRQEYDGAQQTAFVEGIQAGVTYDVQIRVDNSTLTTSLVMSPASTNSRSVAVAGQASVTYPGPVALAEINAIEIGGNGTTSFRIDDLAVEEDVALLVLPIELAAFNAVNQNAKTNLVTWTTAAEEAVDRFEVQHSRNGTDFQTIGTVAPRNAAASYSFVHEGPPAGVHYYRLKEVALDGASQVFHVVTVNVAGSDAFAIFPNPATGFTTVSLAGADAGAVVRMLDSNGRLLRELVTTDQSVELALGNLPGGVYLLQVAGPSGIETKKLVVR